VLSLRFPAYYPGSLLLLFGALFVGLPGQFFGRDMQQLRSLRQGRCLEEMLSVGLTPQGIADTLAWGAWSGLARSSAVCWIVVCLPAAWLEPSWLLPISLAALPAGVILIGLSVYLRQVLLLLADSPSRLWRGGLRAYLLTCLCLAPPLYVFAYQDVALGLQLGTLGALGLLAWLRRQAIVDWGHDLHPGPLSAVASARAWGGWLARLSDNPIFVRELRASRGYSLWMWGALPLLVLGALGLALPTVVDVLGTGSGFFLFWLGWRWLNFSVLSERSRALLHQERQGGSWELLIQVGLAGPQFVRGWLLATLFRHFGWMLADLFGLLLLVLYRPEWILPGAPQALLGGWVLGLWLLGLLMDASAFGVGLATTRPASSLLAGLALTTVAGELLLCLGVGLGLCDPHGLAFDFAWQQGVPALALLVWALRLGSSASAQLPRVLDPLHPAEPSRSGCETLPMRVAQGVWFLWVLTSATLAPWRESASPASMLLVLALGHLFWSWLYQPLGWALYPVRSYLTPLRSVWLGGVSALPVVAAVEVSHLYWMFTGQRLGPIQATFLSTDMPRALLCGGLIAGLLQLHRRARGVRVAEMDWRPAGLLLSAVAALWACLWISMRLVFPLHFTAQEQVWWDDTQSRLQRRNGEAQALLHPARWDAAACASLRHQLPLGQSVERYDLMNEVPVRLAEKDWLPALERTLTLDWLDMVARLQGDWVGDGLWELWLSRVDHDPPDPSTLRALAARLQQSLQDDEGQRLVDEDFVRRLNSCPVEVSPGWGWWPQALRVARTRQHLRQSGRFLGPVSPVWTRAHPLYRPSTCAQIARSRAWRTLLLHHVQMALGQPEWPALHLTADGQVFQITREPGQTTYWICDQVAAQASLQSLFSADRQPLRQALYSRCR
jgi:hypothetical protein